MYTKTNSKVEAQLIAAEFLSEGFTSVTITEDTFQIGWWIIQAK